MSNDPPSGTTNLVTIPDDLAPAPAEDMKGLTSGGDYLAQLRFFTSNSKQCKDGDIEVNNYALRSDNDLQVLGKSVDVIIVHWRACAIDTKPDTPIFCYDASSELFERIKQDSGVKESGCLYGPEFLVYIPLVDTWAGFFMGSKSARREAKNVTALMRQACTLTGQHIKTRNYDWWAPKATECLSVLTPPSEADTISEIKRFMNPSTTTVLDTAEEDDSGRET